MRKKDYMISGMIVAAVLSLTACGTNNNQSQQYPTNIDQNKTDSNEKQDEFNTKEAVYTNLGDEKTQEEIKNLLIEAGVKEETANEFITWVKDYNSSVTSQALPVTGYKNVGKDPLDYSEFMVKEEYREDGTMVSGMNCRLTAYLLFNQFIETKQNLTDNDPYIMFDVECIDKDKKFEGFDKEKFVTIFEPIVVKADSSLQEQADAITAEWQERGITIQDNEKISLITMYLHDNYENKRFVGHAGVMLNLTDGVLLVEKYGWNEPFQATKFENEQDMVNYLLNRPDLVGDGTEKPVIVMKNNTVIS